MLSEMSQTEKDQYSMLYDISTEKAAQSCPPLCSPMDCTVHGILQARILEWVTFPFSGDLSLDPSPERIHPLSRGG